MSNLTDAEQCQKLPGVLRLSRLSLPQLGHRDATKLSTPFVIPSTISDSGDILQLNRCSICATSLQKAEADTL